MQPDSHEGRTGGCCLVRSMRIRAQLRQRKDCIRLSFGGTSHPFVMRLALALTLILGGAHLGNGSPKAWPEFRGPHRSGCAVNGDFPVHFGPETNLLWKSAIPGGHSSPV